MVLEITLNGNIFAEAPRPLTSYGEVVLGRARPPAVRPSPVGGTAQQLFAETVTDLLDTDSLDLLRCRFHKPAAGNQPIDARIT